MSLNTQILSKCPKCKRVTRTKKEEAQCRKCGERFDSKEHEVRT